MLIWIVSLLIGITTAPSTPLFLHKWHAVYPFLSVCILFIVVSRFCKKGTDPRLVCVGSISIKDLVLDSRSTLPLDCKTRGKGWSFGNAIHSLIR